MMLIVSRSKKKVDKLNLFCFKELVPDAYALYSQLGTRSRAFRSIKRGGLNPRRTTKSNSSLARLDSFAILTRWFFMYRFMVLYLVQLYELYIRHFVVIRCFSLNATYITYATRIVEIKPRAYGFGCILY